MDSSFELQLMSPHSPLGALRVQSVKVEAWNGQIGILPGHCDTVVRLSSGVAELVLADSKETVYYYLGGGVLEVISGVVYLLCELVQSTSEIDKSRAEEAEKRALERLAQTTRRDIDIMRAQQALRRAQARKKLLEIDSSR